MSNESIKKAQKIFTMLKETMDRDDWKYKASDDEFILVSGCTGEDFPITFIFKVDTNRECLTFRTTAITTFDDDNFLNGALAVCVANHGMVFGHFDYDVSDNSVYYTMANSIVGTDFNEEFFLRMLHTAVSTVDTYNDRFIMLAKGLIDIHKFIDLEGQ